ncbi:MAG: septum formation inhibitor Maf [Acidobacteria bacterium]|nr:septum formation inhibitor Maf [Acidobacteriota bacterium]
MDTLILASASPRRAQLLKAAGIGFEARPSDVDESPRAGESPDTYVKRLALEKADAVAGENPGRLVLGADTTVVVDDRILAKAEDPAEARAMLRMLAGRAHQVLTGVALVGPGISAVDVATTTVEFAPMTSEDIDQYVATDEWRDKAGAYAVQGRAGRFVTRLEGSYTNVVGLPVSLVYHLLMRYPEGRGAVRSQP